MYNNATAMYTDGSKLNNGSVGSACICPSLDILIQRTIEKNDGVYSPECSALSDTVKVFKDKRSTKFMIFSDSLSALLSLKSIQFNIKTNIFLLEIKRNYQQIVKNDPSLIKIVWIPSHIEVSGNEKTDKLANKKTFMPKHTLDNNPVQEHFFRIKS